MECSGSRMLSHIFFRNLFRIFTEFIGIVQRIPHLRKERIHLCSIAVVSASAFALVAPVTALQDKTRAGSEFMSESALKFQLAAPVALVHFCAEQPAAYPQCQVRFPVWFRHSRGLSERTASQFVKCCISESLSGSASHLLRPPQ